MFVSLSCVNNEQQPWPHRYKSTHLCFAPYRQDQNHFVVLIHFLGLWVSVDIWHALVWVDREKENHAHWSLNETGRCSLQTPHIKRAPPTAGHCAGRDVSVYSSVCSFVCFCLFPGAPERKPVRSGPSRFTSVRSWNSVLTSLSLLITCPWPPLRHRWLNFICYSRSIKSLQYSAVTVFIMHFYHGHSQRRPLRVLLLQYIALTLW